MRRSFLVAAIAVALLVTPMPASAIPAPQVPWSGWEPIGQSLVSSPAATSWGNGHLDVFARAQDGAVWPAVVDAAESVSVADLGPMPFGPPYPLFWQLLSSTRASTSWGVGRIDVFVVGTDQKLYRRSTEFAG